MTTKFPKRKQLSSMPQACAVFYEKEYYHFEFGKKTLCTLLTHCWLCTQKASAKGIKQESLPSLFACLRKVPLPPGRLMLLPSPEPAEHRCSTALRALAWSWAVCLQCRLQLLSYAAEFCHQNHKNISLLVPIIHLLSHSAANILTSFIFTLIRIFGDFEKEKLCNKNKWYKQMMGLTFGDTRSPPPGLSYSLSSRMFHSTSSRSFCKAPGFLPRQET